MRRIAALALGGCILGASAGRAGLTPEALPDKNPKWDAPQFVVSDSQGRAYVLRGDTLEVFSVGRDGTLAHADQLSALASGGSDPFIRDVALSPSGSDWLLLDVATGPRLFESGKEVPVGPPTWQAAAVALPHGETWIASLPFRFGGAENQVSRRPDGSSAVVDGAADPPLLLRHAADGWSVQVRHAVAWTGLDVRQGMARGRFEDQVRLAADPKGNLLVVYDMAYRVQKFSAAGKALAEVRVGKGETKWAERSPEAIEAAGRKSEKESGGRPSRESLRFSAATVVHGFTVAGDGRAYLLVEATDEKGESGLALDRLDLQSERLERAWITGGLPLGMRYSLAAARAGLYIVAVSGTEGRWVFPWDVLELGKWTNVPSALLDGQPLNTHP